MYQNFYLTLIIKWQFKDKMIVTQYSFKNWETYEKNLEESKVQAKSLTWLLK